MPFISGIFHEEDETVLEQHTTSVSPSLKKQNQTQESHVTLLNTTANRLQTSTAEGLHAIEALKASMESIAAAAEESSGAAQQSLVATNTIKTATGEILKMSTKSVQSIQHLQDSIATAATQITQSSQNMLRIAESAKEVAEVGARLLRAGEEISTTVNLITKLAKKTSLLALNAAIEATRAKEKGKSFSVMAKEIRALSSKSNTYAQEIQTVVVSIQQNVKNVQTQIITTQQSIQKSSQNAMNNATSMQDLIHNLVDIVKEVHSSLDVLEDLNGEIVILQNSCETIASAAEESAGAVSEVTQTISMQATAFHQSNAAAKMLISLANKIDNGSSDKDIIHDLASAAEELSSAIEEIENTMRQSMLALTQIEEAAELSRSDAQKNEDISQKANEVMQKVHEQIAMLVASIDMIEKKFRTNVSTIIVAGEDAKNNLQQSDTILVESKKIKKSIKYLKKILRKIELTIVQTAALSINGSVEAMRIGDLGEGFAVVSNDIRMLAQNSEKSLDEIADIVDNLEDETENIIESLVNMRVIGTQEAKALLVLADEMDSSIQEIVTNKELFGAMDQKIDEIDTYIIKSKEAAEQTVIAAQLSYTNVREANHAAQEIQTIAQTMAENVSELIEVATLLKDG